MKIHKRTLHLFTSTIAIILALAGTRLLAGDVADIQVSFKLDSRLLSGIYGGERWVSPPKYSGAAAQDTIEARALVIDAQGTPIPGTVEWTPSDPAMVTVSANTGEQIKITVNRAGESKVVVSAQGFSKELALKAIYLNDHIQVEIGQPAPPPVRAAASPDTSAFKSQKEKFSYALGMNIAASLQKQSLEVAPDLLIQGLQDALSGNQALLTQEQMQAALAEMQREMSAKEFVTQRDLRQELAAKNKQEGEAFLAENQKKDGVVTLPSGLQYKVLKAGEGPKPAAGDRVVCHYRGTLLDGTEFDSSYKRGRPASFALNRVIAGWGQAVQLMPAGSKWQLFVPSSLAYGERGSSRANIGPNATLIFEVELLEIKSLSGPAVSGPKEGGQAGEVKSGAETGIEELK